MSICWQGCEDQLDVGRREEWKRDAKCDGQAHGVFLLTDCIRSMYQASESSIHVALNNHHHN